MGEEPMLTGLRAIPDDALYRRLLVHHHSLPPEQPAEDYVYRADVWEMVNKALRAEIARRKAAPPTWWPAPRYSPAPVRRTLRPGTALAAYAGLILLTGMLALVAAR